MDRQHVPALGGRAGVLAPAFDDSVHLDLWIGEEPASGFLAAPVTAEPLQADCFARRHLFEDLAPLWVRRRSSNVPTDQFIRGSCSPVAAAERIVPKLIRPGESRGCCVSDITCAGTLGLDRAIAISIVLLPMARLSRAMMGPGIHDGAWEGSGINRARINPRSQLRVSP
jgi:hypothetical protein